MMCICRRPKIPSICTLDEKLFKVWILTRKLNADMPLFMMCWIWVLRIAWKVSFYLKRASISTWWVKAVKDYYCQFLDQYCKYIFYNSYSTWIILWIITSTSTFLLRRVIYSLLEKRCVPNLGKKTFFHLLVLSAHYTKRRLCSSERKLQSSKQMPHSLRYERTSYF